MNKGELQKAQKAQEVKKADLQEAEKKADLQEVEKKALEQEVQKKALEQEAQEEVKKADLQETEKKALEQEAQDEVKKVDLQEAEKKALEQEAQKKVLEQETQEEVKKKEAQKLALENAQLEAMENARLAIESIKAHPEAEWQARGEEEVNRLKEIQLNARRWADAYMLKEEWSEIVRWLENHKQEREIQAVANEPPDQGRRWLQVNAAQAQVTLAQSNLVQARMNLVQAETDAISCALGQQAPIVELGDISSPDENAFIKLIFIEMISCLLFYLISLGGASLAQKTSNIILKMLYLGFGVVLATLFCGFSLGSIGESHLNPQVSLASLICYKIPWEEILFRLIAQFSWVMIWMTFYDHIFHKVRPPKPLIGRGYACLLETIYAAFLVLARSILYYHPNPLAKLRVVIMAFFSGTVVVLQLATTRGGVNFFTAIAASVVSGDYGALWVYAVAAVGGIIGGFIYRAYGLKLPPRGPAYQVANRPMAQRSGAVWDLEGHYIDPH